MFESCHSDHTSPETAFQAVFYLLARISGMFDDQLTAALAAQGLELVYADPALLVINKPSGLLAVPGRDPSRFDSVACRIQSVISEALVVHRLDMETSGLMVMARGKDAQRAMSIAFQERKVFKRYIAIVDGRPEKTSGEIAFPLVTDWPNRPRQMIDFEKGKPSLTRFCVLGYEDEVCRLELMPLTGRSHQLRVHMLAMGHPIVGDRLYAPPQTQKKAERLLLHASCLCFPHPLDGGWLSFHVPSPF